MSNKLARHIGAVSDSEWRTCVPVYAYVRVSTVVDAPFIGKSFAGGGSDPVAISCAARKFSSFIIIVIFYFHPSRRC